MSTNDCYKLLKYVNINNHLNIQNQLDMAGVQSIGIVTYRHEAGR